MIPLCFSQLLEMGTLGTLWVVESGYVTELLEQNDGRTLLLSKSVFFLSSYILQTPEAGCCLAILSMLTLGAL